MKRMVAVLAVMAVVCWCASTVAAQVTFATAKKDLESHWKKNYPTETILAVTSGGSGRSSEKIVNLKKVPYYSVPAKVRVKRADGSVANFSVSAIYKKPGAAWIFEDVGVGAVEQEKAAGQEPPPFEEAEAMIRKGWVEKFSAQGDTEIEIHKVYPNPKFKASGQRLIYTYRIDVDYRSYNTRYQCRGQYAELVKADASAPWTFQALKNYGDGEPCKGQNLR